MASTAIACMQQLLLLAILLIPFSCCAKPVRQYCGLSLVGDLMLQASIDRVLSDLVVESLNATFAKSSFTSAGNSTTAHGLLQCRTGIDNLACLSCALNATSYLRKTCSGQADGRVWYDDCFLRYSVNDVFSGRVDTEHGGFPFDSHTIGTTAFKDAVGKVLADAAASAASSSDRFGKEQKEFDGNVTIYGTAHCTKDLSSSTCHSCLESAVGAISKHCADHVGCKALFSGCGVRYEIVNFFYESPWRVLSSCCINKGALLMIELLYKAVVFLLALGGHA